MAFCLDFRVRVRVRVRVRDLWLGLGLGIGLELGLGKDLFVDFRPLTLTSDLLFGLWCAASANLVCNPPSCLCFLASSFSYLVSYHLQNYLFLITSYK